MSNQHDGGCLCGAVRYRVEGNPDETEGMGICHCPFCKRRTGGAFGTQVFFPKEAFRLTRGELKTYEYRSDETGRWIRLEFCPNCGTSVTWLAEWNPDLRSIALGTFDDPDWPKGPEWAIFARSAVHWVVHPENVDVYETNPYVNVGEKPRPRG